MVEGNCRDGWLLCRKVWWKCRCRWSEVQLLSGRPRILSTCERCWSTWKPALRLGFSSKRLRRQVTCSASSSSRMCLPCWFGCYRRPSAWRAPLPAARLVASWCARLAHTSLSCHDAQGAPCVDVCACLRAHHQVAMMLKALNAARTGGAPWLTARGLLRKALISPPLLGVPGETAHRPFPARLGRLAAAAPQPRVRGPSSS